MLFGFQAASEFCPHHVGHYLGMDTHDTHLVSRGLGLHPGMVITVEPGIYISADNSEFPERSAITINSPFAHLPCCTLFNLPPPYCITFVFHFSRYYSRLKRNSLNGGGGGQTRCILGDVQVAILSSPFPLFCDWLIAPICPPTFCSGYKVDKNMSPFCDNISIQAS